MNHHPAFPTSPEEAAVQVARRAQEHGVIGVLVDDATDADLRLAVEVYAREHLPGWWVVCGDQETGAAALGALATALTTTHGLQWLAVVDRMLPERSTSARPRDWRVLQGGRPTGFAGAVQVLEGRGDKTRLVLITGHPVLGSDADRPLAKVPPFQERVELPVRATLRRLDEASRAALLCYCPHNTGADLFYPADRGVHILVAGDPGVWRPQLRDPGVGERLSGRPGRDIGQTTMVHLAAVRMPFDLILVTTEDHLFENAVARLSSDARRPTIIRVDPHEGAWHSKVGTLLQKHHDKHVRVITTDGTQSTKDIARHPCLAKYSQPTCRFLNSEAAQTDDERLDLSIAAPFPHVVFDWEYAPLRTARCPKRIFISYCQDQPDVDTIIPQLTQAFDATAFWDKETINRGDSVPEKIHNALTCHTDVTLVLTSLGLPWSQWQQHEASRRPGEAVVPVLLPNATINDVPDPQRTIANVQWTEDLAALTTALARFGIGRRRVAGSP